MKSPVTLSTLTASRHLRMLAAVGTLAIGLAAAQPAEAHDRWHRHHYHSGPSIGLGFSFGSPYYYAPPPPVYVRPAPVYVEPTPVYSRRLSLPAQVQWELRARGYYRGPVDGVIGPRTSLAIQDYQIDREIPVTGTITGSLLRSLGL